MVINGATALQLVGPDARTDAVSCVSLHSP